MTHKWSKVFKLSLTVRSLSPLSRLDSDRACGKGTYEVELEGGLPWYPGLRYVVQLISLS